MKRICVLFVSDNIFLNRTTNFETRLEIIKRIFETIAPLNSIDGIGGRAATEAIALLNVMQTHSAVVERAPLERCATRRAYGAPNHGHCQTEAAVDLRVECAKVRFFVSNIFLK